MKATRGKKILLCICYGISILIAMATVAAAYAGKINPSHSVIPALLAMAFPVWWLLNLAVLAIDFFIDRRMALIPAAVILLTLGPLLSFAPLNFTNKAVTDENRHRAFTFMTFNTFMLADCTNHAPYVEQAKNPPPYNPTVAFILEQHPDILCAQEFPGGAPYFARGYTLAQYDSVCRAFPHRCESGDQAVFSQLPLIPVEIPANVPHMANICAARVFINGEEFLVMSIHLRSFQLIAEDRELYRRMIQGEVKKNLGEARHQLLPKLRNAFQGHAEEARRIRQAIDSIGIPNVIVAGDFNDVPDCYAMRIIAGDDFKSAFSMAGLGPLTTYHMDHFFFHIDHVLYRGNFNAVEYQRIKIPFSDHYPVAVTFMFDD